MRYALIAEHIQDHIAAVALLNESIDWRLFYSNYSIAFVGLNKV